MLSNIRHIIRQAKKVLAELVRASLARDLKLPIRVMDRTLTLNGKEVLVGDSVYEDDSAVNLKLLSRLGKIL